MIQESNYEGPRRLSQRVRRRKPSVGMGLGSYHSNTLRNHPSEGQDAGHLSTVWGDTSRSTKPPYVQAMSTCEMRVSPGDNEAHTKKEYDVLKQDDSWCPGTAAAVGFEASVAWGTESLLVYFPNIIQIDKMLSVVIVSRNYWWEIIKISEVPRHLKRILIKINEIPLWKILQIFWNCFILIACTENLHYL